jgi:hypothetical protein
MAVAKIPIIVLSKDHPELLGRYQPTRRLNVVRDTGQYRSTVHAEMKYHAESDRENVRVACVFRLNPIASQHSTATRRLHALQFYRVSTRESFFDHQMHAKYCRPQCWLREIDAHNACRPA